ncbi:MAG TPA: PQQ-dependent sugar dehydrogenase [Rhizomicrobium sp.]|nr:PQQ-dependent sugar dehydrogenase [Rhizomicrobium sp.]
MKKSLAVFAVTLAAGPALAAEPDGLILPPGFHASIVADGLTGARHMAFGPNDDLYVSTSTARGQPVIGIYALHLDASHKADKTEHFGAVNGGTAIRVYKGALYAASPTQVVRYPLTKALVPAGEPEVIIDGMPSTGGSGTHSIAFDGKGNLYVSLDGSGNICTDPNAPKDARPLGLTPCPGLNGRGGVWRFSDSKTGQKFPGDGEQYATGVRNMGAMEWSSQAGALYGVTHGRDTTHNQFPTLVSQADDDAIADEMHRITKGTNMGWPFTYYDAVRKMRLTGPEYGGDNKTPADASVYDTPVAAFAPKRVAPLEVVFNNGTQFPRKYRGGAFIATHGTNGPQIPGGHGGYSVIFVGIDRNGDVKVPEVFADGFAGPTQDDRYTGHATYRPVGEAVGPDGSLYVADSNKGRIWRISYSGK